MYLFVNNTTNIFSTIATVIFLLAFFFLERHYIKKKGDEINKFVLIIIYLISFFFTLGGAIFIMFVWNFPFEDFFATFWQDALAYILVQIGDIIISVVIILFVSLLLKIVKIILKKSALREGPNRKRRVTMLKVTNSLINYTVKIIALLVILSIWGVDVIPALAGLGILGLVVGLGAQSLIKDLIAGFFIIFEHHFDIDDVVEINGFKGRVIDIGLKTTKVQNWKNDIKIFANGTITDPINYSVADSVAVIEFGIAYGENIQKTIDIINAEMPKYKALIPELLEVPSVVGVTELANSSVNLRIVAKTLPESQYGVERKIRQGIKEILDQNGIEIPFPQIVVHEAKK
ncbi:MAG: mechanosensitive ion channel family protein [Candidatus Izemoplasmatales bacterium]|nr:mechanosensitive ion channel family protein [Candidatus Izemoplasmatales bacterium]